MMKGKQSNKKNSFVNLLISIVILILINYIGSFVFKRFDLTSEKRYTLSNASKDLVGNLQDVVLVRIYLEGELPSGLKKLKDATREMLDELRVYSNGNIEYQFVNPSESDDLKTRNEVYQQLTKKGLQYTNLEIRSGDKYSEQIIFPGAIFAYQGKEVPLQLLKSQTGADPEQMVNISIQQLEYEIVSTINKIVKPVRKKIAFIEGNGELEPIEVADITKTLSEFYTVERINISGQLNSLKEVDAIIIAQPDSAYVEKDKFIIDQFVMRGGKVLWLIDPMFASMDSLQAKSTTIGLPLSLNLDDILFKYGVRVNPNLILDLQALPIPIVTGMIGNQPKQELFPWFYFPLIMPQSKHPIVNNIDAIKSQFVSSIDTVGGKGIKKTVLLTSSQYSKILPPPVRISLNILRDPPDRRQYIKSFVPIAVLLEGEFESVFKNRVPPQISESKEINFKERSKPNKMIVVSDGDIIKNQFQKDRKTFYPLGYDKFTDKQYANKDFILNAVNYLCDDTGLIEARTKEFKIRLLDNQKISNQKLKWQSINIVLPILLIFLFGAIRLFWRIKKYARNDKS
jgi:ABC-2 type transport system permease protein